MKYLILLLLLSTSAYSFDACTTAAWSDPDPKKKGEGINVEVLDDLVIAFFYDGSGKKWLSMKGERPEGNIAILDVMQTVNFGTAWVGVAGIEIVDENHLIFEYKLKFDRALVDKAIPFCSSKCELIGNYVRQSNPCTAG